MSTHTLEAGAMIGEDVELVQPLEAGGMGSVWVAKHLSMPNMAVAVKFVHEELAAEDPSILDRFDREATVLRRVKHPHVVKVFEYAKLADGTPYIVMELLKGESLVERLERTEHALSFEDLGKFLAQTADALSALHGQGIVHRDLKGENVFLIGDGNQVCVKLLDFGLAKTPEQPGLPKLTSAGMLVGSPEYMSPEQIVSARDVDHQADLWALGVLAYISTTLSLPFQGSKLSEVFAAIRSGTFTPPSRKRAGLPRGVDAWFARAFAVDRSERFSSAHAMAEAWTEACGLATAEPKDGRSRTTIALVALAAVALLSVIAVVLSLG